MRLLVVACVVLGCGGDDSAMAIDAAVDASRGDAPADASVDAQTADAATDAAGGGDASTDASGGFDPTNVPGVVLWLEAARGVTLTNNSVSSWADQTAFRNDATQSNTALQPSLVAAAINGLPAIHFTAGSSTGRQLAIADSQSMDWGTGDYAILLVARFANNPQNTDFNARFGTFFAKVPAMNFTGSYLLLFGNLATTQQAGIGFDEGSGGSMSHAAAFNDGTGRLLVARRSVQTLDLRVNAASVATMTQLFFNADVSQSGRPVFLGAYTQGTQAAQFGRLDGDIAEIVAVKGTLSATDLARLESYLITKYGL